MPFSLSNAPSTFQALMNEVFTDYLHKFVLVFFDDILIFSKSWPDHLQHLKKVFQLIRAHRLYLKRTKSTFGRQQVTYLGHLMTVAWVTVDPDKIAAVTQWPVPRTISALRGFLGLAAYYRKFIQDYAALTAPLTNLLHRNSFQWTDEAATAFQNLKTTLATAPVLRLPDFGEMFIVECDASGSGIGAVLLQVNHPIAYFSRQLPLHQHKLAAYERELIGLAKAVCHWRPYLWGRYITIRTDHYSLKYLLDQRISTSPQQ
ncbi:uncharacterized mitochondrial protein AtMg00860-like [Aristolochia californica]|uniref:uncharacterized mitochondrial protein AtMg00860-like n=1 Tax=Aristolochia californica TaxID=171875 RepID=UPI0035E1A4B8